MSKKKVLGREFKQPRCKYNYLIDKQIWDSRLSVFMILLSFIPFAGIGVVLGNVLSSYEISNKFGLKENSWRVAVYGSVIQTISLTVAYVVFLQ